ncbi:MAG: transcriptional regulator [Cyanobium sp.]
MSITFHFGPFRVRDGESLWLDDTLIPLSPLQLRLLSFLCRHPQEVLEKERIVTAVWGHSEVSDVSLARAVHGLRTRLAQGAKANELIRNIYGRGYILTTPVRLSEEAGSRPPVAPLPTVPQPAEPREPAAAVHAFQASPASERRVSVVRPFAVGPVGA